LSDFLEQPAMQGIQFLEANPGLTVESRYFLAHGVVSVNDQVQHFHSLIEKGRGGFAVIYRSRGTTY
jgi:type II secretory pathway component PulK